MTSSRLHRIATPAEPETPRDAIPGVAPSEEITPAELRLASRNHDIPVVDPAVWRLTVGGRVRRELSLSLTDLRARPAMTRAVTLECAGNGRAHLSPRPVSQPWLLETVGTAEWTGTSLRGLLEEAGADGRAVEVLFRGLDRGIEGGDEQHFERSLPRARATREEVMIAYAINGRPLPPQHGLPAVGADLDVHDRAVIRTRHGRTTARWAWREWEWSWSPGEPGIHELCCRATDSTGRTQPLEPAWNLGGYANNAVQRLRVVARPSGAAVTAPS